MRRSLQLTTFLCLTLPSLAAQEVSRSAPIQGEVRNAGVYHVVDQTWTRSVSTYGVGLQDAIFRNDRLSGYWGLQDQAMRFTDEGRLPGSGDPLFPGESEAGLSDAYRVQGFQFGYCIMSEGQPNSARLEFRQTWSPCGDPKSFAETAAFEVSGLPDGGCWTVTLDLAGTTQEFIMLAEGGDAIYDGDRDLDSFGWSINIDAGQGDGFQQEVGVILAGDNRQTLDEGSGTIFKQPGAGAGTGLGTVDLFWHDGGSSYNGCGFFGGCMPCANFQLVLYGEPEDGIPSLCGSASPNSVSVSGAELSVVAGFGTARSEFELQSVPDQPGILFTGPSSTQTPFGCGDRCVGGAGVLRYGPFWPSNNSLLATIDMSLSPNGNVQYWYRDPANAAACNNVFNLSNAVVPNP